MYHTAWFSAGFWLLLGAGATPGAGPGSGNEQLYLVWGLVCIAVALILFCVELVVPSAGLLALTAALALVAGIVLLFLNSTTLGLIAAIGILVAAPFGLAFALKLWPNTPIARLLLLKGPARDTAEPAPHARDASRLIGTTGRALTDLRPVGTCLIDGQRTECLADGGMIPAGTPVRVVAADGLQVKVRPEEE